MEDSNIGQKGPKSIRLNGQQIGNLPIAEAVRAKSQMGGVYENERQNRIKDIKARYPPGTVEYYKARINECRMTLDKVSQMRDGQTTKIGEYQSLIALCKHRDQQEQSIPEDDPERADKIRALRETLPPYNVGDMLQQVKQFEEGVVRCSEVIQKENDSIAELTGTLGKCKQRDIELNLV